MINWEKSAELNDCTTEHLQSIFKKYPKSGRRIIRACDVCGDENDVVFNGHSELCLKCSRKTDGYRKKRSDIAIERFSNPAQREAARLLAIDRFSNQSARDMISLKSIERWSDPENRKDMSDKLKKYNIDNPHAGKEHSERMVQFYKDRPEAREAARLKTIRYNEEHPEAGKDHSDRLKNSAAMKTAIENQIGGNDIVMHHYLYDDADLSKYTMPMTRSEHGMMHARMRADGYEVQHINSDTDDNGLWGYK